MKKGIPIIIGAVTIIIVFGIISSSGNNDEYQQEIRSFWEDRVEFLKNSESSPYKDFNKEFQDIFYFQPSKEYKIQATLDRFTKREVYTIANSDGSTTNYIKFAYASFKLNGQSHRLLILKSLGFGNIYFTAFGDDTSGKSTYGGGRYLDLAIGKSDNITIDFNKAYNPYCAYIDEYSCPLPPEENLLAVSIKAGEKYLP